MPGFLLALEFEGHGLLYERLRGSFVDLVTFMQIDGAPDLALEAGVEEA